MLRASVTVLPAVLATDYCAILDGLVVPPIVAGVAPVIINAPIEASKAPLLVKLPATLISELVVTEAPLATVK